MELPTEMFGQENGDTLVKSNVTAVLGRQHRGLGSSPAKGDGVWSSRHGLWTGAAPFPSQKVAREWEDGWAAHRTALEDVGIFPLGFLPLRCLPSTCTSNLPTQQHGPGGASTAHLLIWISVLGGAMESQDH